MKIRCDFLATRDIDWFCLVSGIPIQVASAGGIFLPDFVNDRQKMIESQMIVSQLPFLYSEEAIYVNEELIKRKLREDDNSIYKELNISMEDRIRYYMHSFIPYARKGFFCFDRSLPQDPESTLYDLIAFPYSNGFRRDNFEHPSTRNELFMNISSSEWIIKNIERFEGLDFSVIMS